MIQINRSYQKPIVVEDATTVKEAVKYAIRHNISLKGADLRGANLRNTDLSNANLSGADLSGANLRNMDLSNANLSGADLSGANLSWADLYGADLSGANLSGANLDFSCLPLWCGSLDMRIDKKIFCQLLYHTFRAGKSIYDEEVNKLFSIPEVVELANQFHRVKECGKIESH